MIFGEGLLLLVGDAPKVANVEVPTPDFFFEAWSKVATKILKDFCGVLYEEIIIGWEPVSIIHCTRPGACINRLLH